MPPENLAALGAIALQGALWIIVGGAWVAAMWLAFTADLPREGADDV